MEAILIDHHMLFYRLLVFMQTVAFILVHYKDFMDTEKCSRNESVCIRHRLGLLVRTPSIINNPMSDCFKSPECLFLCVLML